MEEEALRCGPIALTHVFGIVGVEETRALARQDVLLADGEKHEGAGMTAALAGGGDWGGG